MAFKTVIPGGVYDGKMIEITGIIPYKADNIRIILLTGHDITSDYPLHLDIQINNLCVIRNHQENGQWGPEERQGFFPFRCGKEFTMTIAVERSKYRIAVNNQLCWDFKHRLPFEQVKSLAIYGSVDIDEIQFTDRENPERQGEYLPTCPLVPVVNPANYFNLGQFPCVQPTRPCLPTVYNPSIPCAYPIYGGLKPGMAIYISGRPSSNPHKFTVNLQKGAEEYPLPDVAFHFDCRFFNRSIVRNNRSNGGWVSEETYISHFPFQPGVSFDLIIQIEAERYSVSINGESFTDFRHRLRPLEMFDTLYIFNDVSISSISVL